MISAQIYEALAPLRGQIDATTLGFIRRANLALDKWWQDCDQLHQKFSEENTLLRKFLVVDHHHAKLWIASVAMRSVIGDHMTLERRELAFHAKDAAIACLDALLSSEECRAAMRYATHEWLVNAVFAGTFLLKMVHLFPGEINIIAIVTKVQQLADIMYDSGGGAYAWTLQFMLEGLKQRFCDRDGASSGSSIGDIIHDSSSPVIVDPEAIPLWLQESHINDLGLPENGNDGVLLLISTPNGWVGEYSSVPEAR
jgi:hypothetical protein